MNLETVQGRFCFSGGCLFGSSVTINLLFPFVVTCLKLILLSLKTVLCCRGLSTIILLQYLEVGFYCSNMVKFEKSIAMFFVT